MSVYIDGYLIDASINENHTFESEVTKYPVESGSVITDNVRNKPVVVTIEGIVSDNPIGTVATIRNRSRVTDPAAASTNLINPADAGDFLPSDEALAKLLAIHNAKQPIVVETTLKRYDSMVMTNLEIPRDAATGAALHFTATFEQVVIITNARLLVRVAIPSQAGKSSVIRSAAGFDIVKAGPPPTMQSLSGKTVTYQPSSGTWAYPDGSYVPDSDLPGIASANSNTTHWNPATGDWYNTDGTSVTQANMDKADGTKQWWKDAYNPSNYVNGAGI